MLAFKASTVEACGIWGGKLFHVKIVLGQKTVFKSIDIGLIWLEPRGWVRESFSFGWRYGWDVIATTPFIILCSIISLEMIFLSSKVLQFKKISISVTLLHGFMMTVYGCSALARYRLPYYSPPPRIILIPHTGAVPEGCPDKCLACLCFYRGLSCADIPLYKT